MRHAFAAGLALLGASLVTTGPARSEQHGDGYGPRDADPREYGGGQGQYVVVAPVVRPAPYYVPAPYGPAPYAYAPPPVAYGYAPAPYVYAPRPLPALRPPTYRYAAPFGAYAPGSY